MQLGWGQAMHPISPHNLVARPELGSPPLTTRIARLRLGHVSSLHTARMGPGYTCTPLCMAESGIRVPALCWIRPTGQFQLVDRLDTAHLAREAERLSEHHWTKANWKKIL